jgi:hypothetical protein
MDEFETRKGSDCLRNFSEKGFALDLAGCTKPSCDDVERSVVIAGMADKLPCTLGHRVKDLVQRLGIELAGGRDADRSIGSADMALSELRQRPK